MSKKLTTEQIHLLTDMAWHKCMGKHETNMIVKIIKKGEYDIIERAVLNILRTRYLDAIEK